MNQPPHKIVERIKEFADLRWPDRDLLDRLRKIGEEYGEMNEAAARFFRLQCLPDVPDEAYMNALAHLTMEVADVAILLQDILILSGVEGDLIQCMMAKMEVNERREWPQEQDGTSE